MTDTTDAPERVRVEYADRGDYLISPMSRLSTLRMDMARLDVIRTHPDGTEERMGMREALRLCRDAAAEWAVFGSGRDPEESGTAMRVLLAAAALSLLLGEERK